VTAENMKTLSLGEIRAVKDAGKLRATRPDAPEFDLPDDFWTQAKLVKRVSSVDNGATFSPPVTKEG